MGTKKSNVELFQRINEGWLHQIGADGQYNRDRIFKSLGIAPLADGSYGRGFKLSDKDRERVQAAIERDLGFKFPGGIEIDPAGNMNENEGVGKWAKDWRTYAAIGAGLTGVGALGYGPMAGLFGGSGAGAGASAGAAAAEVLPSAAIPGLHAAVPGAIASQGASAGISAAGAAGAAGKAARAAAAKKAMSTADIAKDVIGSFGEAAGNSANTMAHNRGVRMSAAETAEALNIARRRDDRESRDDAMRAYQQAQYLGGADRGQGPGVAGQYSKPLSLPKLDPAIVEARRAEAAKRLQTPYQDFAFDPKDLNAGGWEKAANLGSIVGGVASAVPDSVWKKLGRLIFVALVFTSAGIA